MIASRGQRVQVNKLVCHERCAGVSGMCQCLDASGKSVGDLLYTDSHRRSHQTDPMR